MTYPMKKNISTPCIEITQPIGTFYLGKIKASELRGCVNISRKSENLLGQQRDLNRSRVNEIARYCKDPDATFPTSVILSVETSDTVQCSIENGCMSLDFEDIFGEVIDGQHRLLGILESSNDEEFELPIVFMLNPTVEEKAYVFSIINSKQTKVNPSLIYDLFDVSEHRSPKKTVHLLARALNSRDDSPFYNRLKMLGKNSEDQKNATLSQGTFSKRVLKLITKDADKDSIDIKLGKTLQLNPNLILRETFIKDRDDIMLKILMNYFNALRNVFTSEWENPKENILWKSTGFNAMIDCLPEFYQYGLSHRTLKIELFQGLFEKLSGFLDANKIKLTSENFGSGEAETKRLKDLILKACFNQ